MLPLIIFGTRMREKELGTGKFYCPNCGRERRYKHKRADKYFALYFIPLLPIESMGEFIECQSCHQKFSPDLRKKKAPSGLDLVLPEAKRDLNSGTPLHMAQRKLANQGLTENEAEQVVKQALSGPPRRCATCGFLYQSTITHCSNCGSPLSPAG
jgi:hypothetical protein